jgi:hypothetical protein
VASLVLQPRSLILFRGEAYSDFLHSIGEEVEEVVGARAPVLNAKVRYSGHIYPPCKTAQPDIRPSFTQSQGHGKGVRESLVILTCHAQIWMPLAYPSASPGCRVVPAFKSAISQAIFHSKGLSYKNLTKAVLTPSGCFSRRRASRRATSSSVVSGCHSRSGASRTLLAFSLVKVLQRTK